MQRVLGEQYTDNAFVTMHVAGTNGKGSVCRKLAASIQHAAEADTGEVRVGLFASPHISSFRERMSVNGDDISEREIEQLLPPILDACDEHDIPATFFEITTLLALRFFAHRRVHAAVFEVGLGGRLDSTNIVQPSVAVVTSIALDHTHLLGDTIDAIASEKAGIIKPGVPCVVVGPDVPEHVTRAAAERVGARHVRVLASDYVHFDHLNAAIARTALCEAWPALRERIGARGDAFPSHALRVGLNARPPCRFERRVLRAASGNRNVAVLVDVAHNANAFSMLIQRLERLLADAQQSAMRLRVVVGLSSGKDVDQVLRCIVQSPRVHAVHLVAARNDRAIPIQQLEEAMQRVRGASSAVKLESVREDGDVRATVRHAVECAASASKTACSLVRRVDSSSLVDNALVPEYDTSDALPLESDVGVADELVVVCGSFFIMAEARQVLDGMPHVYSDVAVGGAAEDADDLNEKM
eukprot:TRINITY_DN66358_c7_g5_i1.p1 TRINITY_DN66358_c7_g5~~TRINITY_DN66358_c7_g5_i1.p1  ORF type:complete len:484 (-),score=187.91 TRINITY_DN66358_c7_g5_i1:1144-2553(-)